MKKNISLLLVLVSFFLVSTHLGAEDGLQFIGPKFTKLLCKQWNSSKLPKLLGTEKVGGNGWIVTENNYLNKVRNKQVMIISRRDCSNIPKVQLTIENKNGLAVCSYGGKMTEDYTKAEWAFAPKTVHWYKFATGKWGYFQMPSIMSGFRGPMFVARANIDNFGIFWEIAGRLAKKLNADYKKGCPELDKDDIEDIENYIKKIK